MRVAIFASNQFLLITAINLKLTKLKNDDVHLYTPFEFENKIFQKVICITNGGNIEDFSVDLANEMKAAYFAEENFYKTYKYDDYDEILTMGYTYFPYWLCAMNRKYGNNTKLIRLCDGVVFKYSYINYHFNKSFEPLLGKDSFILNGFDDEYYYGNKIQRISSGHNEVEKEMDRICCYSDKLNKLKDFDYIFFTSSTENGVNVIPNETPIIEQIAKKIGKNNLLVRPHPKRNVSDLMNLGVEIDTFRWCAEFLYPHVDLNKKTFISVGTNAILTPFEMFGVHPKKVMLLDKVINIDSHEVFSRAYKSYIDNYKDIYLEIKSIEEVL